MAKVLFEPNTQVVDSVTYDITAWSVPYFYGMEAYATSTVISSVREEPPAFEENDIRMPAYAVFFKWNSLEDAKFLAKLLRKGIKVRFTTRQMRIDGKTLARGTLIVTKRDNPHLEHFEKRIGELANESERTGYPVETGFMDALPDIGSLDVKYIAPPRVAMLAGDGAYEDGVGPTWHFMEQQLGYPMSMIWTRNLGRTDLEKYNVLIMQHGGYWNMDKSSLKEISDWVSAGGKLILVGSAIRKFVDSDHASISKYNSDREKKEMEDEQHKRENEEQLTRHEDEERNYVRNIIPGAIFRVEMDNSHPLAFGYGDEYFSLKTSSDRYGYLESQNVGVIKSEQDHMAGFAGQYVLEDVAESMVFGVENKGRGEIIYFVDNPLFRSFWYNGKLMIANALFFVGN